MQKVTLSALVFLLVLFPYSASAHGAGESIQVEHNGYTLSLGSAAEFVTAAAAERLNLEIETVGDEDFQGYTGVWVRIVDPSGEFLFAGTIDKAPTGLLTGMTFFFPVSGTYDMTLRFMDDEKVIAEGQFPLPVRDSKVSAGGTKENGESGKMLPLYFFVSGLGGLIIGLLFAVRLRKSALTQK